MFFGRLAYVGACEPARARVSRRRRGVGGASAVGRRGSTRALAVRARARASAVSCRGGLGSFVVCAHAATQNGRSQPLPRASAVSRRGSPGALVYCARVVPSVGRVRIPRGCAAAVIPRAPRSRQALCGPWGAGTVPSAKVAAGASWEAAGREASPYRPLTLVQTLGIRVCVPCRNSTFPFFGAPCPCFVAVNCHWGIRREVRSGGRLVW